MALVGLFCAVIFSQVIDWYLKFQLPQISLKGIKYLKNRPELGIALLFILVIISALATETREFWGHGVSTPGKPAPWDGEATRSLGLALGALAGLYGLVLAGRRLQVSQDQVDISQKQAQTAESNLFNDRLKSGLTFLDNESISIRCAGILLLEQYALNASVASSEKVTIGKVLVNFIRHRAVTPVENKRPDLKLAISALTKTIPLDERFKGQEELLLNDLDLSGFSFEGMDLSFFNFDSSNMKDTIFASSKLSQTNFRRANLEDATFLRNKCVGTTFENANMAGSYLIALELDEGSSLVDANLEYSFISGLSILGSDCRGADFSESSIGLNKGCSEGFLDNMMFEKGRPPKITVEREDGKESFFIDDQLSYEWIDGERVMNNLSVRGHAFGNSPWWREEEKQK